jgi:hypothetical protein
MCAFPSISQIMERKEKKRRKRGTTKGAPRESLSTPTNANAAALSMCQ